MRSPGIGPTGKYRCLDPHLHRGWRPVQPDDVSMSGFDHSASDRHVPFAARQTRFLEREQPAMSPGISVGLPEIHNQWMYIGSSEPEPNDASSDLGASDRSQPQARRAAWRPDRKRTAPAWRSGRHAHPIWLAIRHDWRPDRWGGIPPGQRWQRGQKQVERPPETMRTIWARPQVRQRWPARS